MKIEDLKTKEEITWCPGCPNFVILEAAKEALADLTERNKIKIKDVVTVVGIGCHAKIFDYLNLSSFYGIHGRVLPVCLGIKLANPKLTVLGFGGDGDTYAEGISHFVHAGRYNADLTMIVHNNQVFALTVGQATPTTEEGFIDGSTPFGLKDPPLNPIALALISGASFVARGYALEKEHLKELIKAAIEHQGFSFIDVLQPCIVFHNAIPYFQKNIYKLEGNRDFTNFPEALELARQWNYSFEKDIKVPVGIFYKIKKPTFEEKWPQLKEAWYLGERKVNRKRIIEEFR